MRWPSDWDRSPAGRGSNMDYHDAFLQAIQVAFVPIISSEREEPLRFRVCRVALRPLFAAAPREDKPGRDQHHHHHSRPLPF